MIDTLVLRIHNLKKYDALIRRLDLKRNDGYKISLASADKDEAKRLQNIGYRNPKELLQIMEVTKTAEFVVRTQVQKQVNASHHYMFSYRIDFEKEFMELNFSAPKYKFGTNVLQLVEHQRDRDFRYTENCTLKHNVEHTIASVKPFIIWVLNREFPTDKIDLWDVEVNRIDFCFNQLHRGKEEALEVLKRQKELERRHAREDEGGELGYKTTLMYKTARFSEKVYHKGAEFKKHDLKELSKINAERGDEYFNIKQLQAFADRMLRYEITLRSSGINYLFKRTMFRRDCPFFQMDYKTYKKVAAIKQRNDRIAEKIGSLPQDQREAYRQFHPDEKISKENNKTYKYISHLLERKPRFMLEISEKDSLYNKQTVNYESEVALFNKGILRLGLKKLLKFIDDFQVKRLPSEEVVSSLIDRYNREHNEKLPQRNMILFFLQLEKFGSFKEASKMSRVSRATYYRYKGWFKKIGITEKNISPAVEYTIPQAPVDFKEYHTFLMTTNLVKA